MLRPKRSASSVVVLAAILTMVLGSLPVDAAERFPREYSGIGSRFEIRDSILVVTDPLDGSPAKQAGLKAGDEIVEIDGKPVPRTVTDDDVFTLLRGPAGSVVTVTIRRGESELLVFQITRALIAVPTTYEGRYVDGTHFDVGMEGDLQVWLTAWLGSELQTMLQVVNGSDRTITFYPDSVRVEALKQTKDGLARRPVKTLTARQVEERTSSRNALIAGLAAFGTSGANSPQPRRTRTSGQYEVQNGYGTTRGSYYGTITEWPTQADYDATEALNRARLNAMTSRLRESYRAISTSLMRRHTLDPHTYYGGMVYSGKSGNDYVVTVPFGEASFEFRISFPR